MKSKSLTRKSLAELVGATALRDHKVPLVHKVQKVHRVQRVLQVPKVR